MRPHPSIRVFSWVIVCMVLIFMISACGRVPPTVRGRISFFLRNERGDVEPDTTAGGIPLFRPSPDAMIKAIISISGLEPGRHEEYHFVWLKPDGKELFRKLESFEADNDSDRFSSSIGIDPARDRDLGIYEAKLYRFRNLLATASFELRQRPELHAILEIAGDYNNGTELNYLSGKEQPRIFMKEDAVVRVRIPVEGFEVGFQEHMRIRWVGPDGETLFEKDVDNVPESTETVLKSSIGIDPDRERATGVYTVEVFRGDSILVSGSFELVPEEA